MQRDSMRPSPALRPKAKGQEPKANSPLIKFVQLKARPFYCDNFL
jgi:hypothetical protein